MLPSRGGGSLGAGSLTYGIELEARLCRNERVRFIASVIPQLPDAPRSSHRKRCSRNSFPGSQNAPHLRCEVPLSTTSLNLHQTSLYVSGCFCHAGRPDSTSGKWECQCCELRLFVIGIL